MISVKERSDFQFAVIGNPDLSKLAYRVAIMLTKYLNRKKGYAWPSVRRLADDLHSDRRNVQRALAELHKAGWWVRECSTGRKHTNHYKPGLGLTAKVKTNVGDGKKRRNRDALSSRPQRAVTGTRKGVTVTLERASPAPPEPSKEPLKNAASSARLRAQEPAAPERDRGGVTGKRSSGRYKSSQRNGRGSSHPVKVTTIPEFGPEEAEAALNIAGWGEVRARQEYETNKRNFRQWNRDRGNVSWLTWCEQGREIDKKNATQQSNGGGRPRRDLQGQNGVMRAYHKHKSRAAALVGSSNIEEE